MLLISRCLQFNLQTRKATTSASNLTSWIVRWNNTQTTRWKRHMQKRDITTQIWSITYTQIWSKKGPLRWDEIFLLYSRTALWFANSTADPLGSAASLAIMRHARTYRLRMSLKTVAFSDKIPWDSLQIFFFYIFKMLSNNVLVSNQPPLHPLLLLWVM